MKIPTALVTLLVVVCGGLIAEPTSNTVLVTSRGIGANWDPAGQPNINVSLPTQVTQAKSILEANTPGKDVFLVGQSMGGVRALGIASVAASKVKAVVTIGSPVRGMSPLWNAGPNASQGIKQRLASVIRTLGEGLYKVQVQKSGWGWLGSGIVDYVAEQSGNPKYAELKQVLSDDDYALVTGIKMMGGLDSPVLATLATGSTPIAIQDLVPRSVFLSNYIAKEHDETTSYRVVSGSHKEWRVKYGWFSITWYQVTVTDYKTVTVTNSVVSDADKRIARSVKLLNVVGTQNNPVYLTRSVKARAAMVETFKGLSKDFGDASDAYRIQRDTDRAVADKLWRDYWWNPLAWPLVAVANKTADDLHDSMKKCDAAKAYTDTPSKIIEEAFGTPSNDGFIPVSDQYRFDMGGVPLLDPSTQTSQRWDVNLSHAEELDATSLWGGSTSSPDKIGSDTGGVEMGIQDDDRPVGTKPVVVQALYYYHGLRKDAVVAMYDTASKQVKTKQVF